MPMPPAKAPAPLQDEGVYDDAELSEILLNTASASLPPTFPFPPSESSMATASLGPDSVEPEIQDPEKAYALYYKSYGRLMRRLLPRGKEFKDARRLVRNEVLLFLNEGHARGRDSRQARYRLMEEAVVLLQRQAERPRPDLVALLESFRQENVRRGFRGPQQTTLGS